MKQIFIKIAFFLSLTVILSSCALKTESTQKTLSSDDSLSKIKQKGKIIVGTYEQIPPISYLDENKNNIGHDIDIAKELAKELGVKIEFKNLYFPDLFAQVKTGDIDIILSAITITQERSKEMLFSVPYFDGGQSILVRADNTSINSLQDLNGKKIGSLKGTTGEKYISSLNLNNSELIFKEDGKEGRKMLEDGVVDAWIEDYVGASGYIKNTPNIKIIGKPINEEYYGVVTKLGNNTLIDEINRILREMKRDGRLIQIKNKWL